MDIGAFFLSAALLGLVVYLIARPLLNQRRPHSARPEPAVALEAERERLLAALRDLELDHATGKVSAEDYALQRPQLVALGAAVLRELDELTAKPAGRRAASVAVVDDEIEAAVRQLRSSPRRPKSPSGQGGRSCPACGQPASAQDRFCASCGTPLSQAARQAEAAR